jgi:putative DNA primase/helicase
VSTSPIRTNFISECCVQLDNARVSAKDLKEKYLIWCKENGEYPMKSGVIKEKLEDRGFKCRRSGANGSDQWHGIGLLSN